MDIILPHLVCVTSPVETDLLMECSYSGPDMDGFKLLEHIGLELDLPVISKLPTQRTFLRSSALSLLQFHTCLCSEVLRDMLCCCVTVMSSNGETNVVLRGVTHGAVDFLIKPVRVEELRNVWQHVVRRKRDQAGSIILLSLQIAFPKYYHLI